MSKSTKLNELGNQVLNAFKASCSYLDDVKFYNVECGNKYFSFTVSEGMRYLGRNLIKEAVTVTSSFETLNICTAFFTVEVEQKDDCTYPVIEVLVSLL